MKRRPIGEYVTVLALLTLCGVPSGAAALGTAFTYQGQLQQSGSAATGPCDLQFLLFDAAGSGAPPTGGNQIGNTAAADNVPVSNGLFALPLDFGAGAFSTGNDRWLQIAVRCPAGSGSYQTLAPRQPLTPSPFAVFANTVADGSVSSTKLAPGAVMTSQLATNAVTSAQIADGTITTNDLANGAVSTAKIGDGQVTAAKLVAPLSLTSTVAHSFVGAFDGISTGLNSVGVSGTANNGSNAYGVYGLANAGYGVVGSSTSGTGVLGQTAIGEGVTGTSNNGVGVLGQGMSDAGVKGTSNEDGVIGESTGSGAGVRGVSGQGQGAAGVRGDSTDGFGVLGQSDNGAGVAGVSVGGDGVTGTSVKTGGTGVHGRADNGDTARGVFGESADGAGVYGSSTNSFGVVGVGASVGLIGVPTNSGAGVVGLSANLLVGQSDSADAVGVRGVASSGVGVLGESTSGVGMSGKSESSIGVRGESTSNVAVRGESTMATGVFGTSTNGIGVYGTGGGYAGYFGGRVSVTGVLTAGVKPFKIDHPLDPANKYLMHAAVESPDMKNIYDGIAVLDDEGAAVIELPVWFEALNRDFRYQLTCIGGVAPVYIAEEVSDHHFRIAGGTHGLKVSWQVTGIRKDAFANAHPLEVELDKPADERGRYLYPEEAGMPASLSVDRARQVVAQAHVQ